MRWICRIAYLFRRPQAEARMSAEMRTHLEFLVEENLARGVPPVEARRQALRDFGGVEQMKERGRDVRGFVWLEQAQQDVRYAWRQLMRAPGFTLVVVLTLAIGIGATTAIFSVVNSVILNPIAGAGADHLVQIGQREVFRGEVSFAGVSPPVQQALLANRDFFSGLAWCDTYPLERKTEEFTVKESGAFVSENFFTVLGARPLLGRTFAPGEAGPFGDKASAAGDTPVVLSHAWWQSTFGGDAQVLGRIVELSGRRFTVVGVMPAHFQFPLAETKCWVPSEPYRPAPPAIRAPATQIVTRMKPGMTIPQVQAMLGATARRLMEEHPGPGYGDRWRATPQGLTLDVRSLQAAFQDGRGAGELRRTLFGLLAAIGFVLLIVCANVANLTLARVERRRHELAIRAALGAGRARLMRQLLLENLLLAFLGGGAGLIVTAWGMKALASLSSLPRLRPIELDLQVLGLGLVVSVATGLLFGLTPMWRGSRVRVIEALAESGTNSTGGRQRSRQRSVLVVVQVAVTVVLLTGAGLMLRSVVELLRVNPGFDPENLLWVDVSLPSKYEPRNIAQGTALKNVLFGQLHERFAALPGVTAVGFLQNHGTERLVAEGREEPVFVTQVACGVEENDTFRAMRIPLLAGRTLTASDVPRKELIVINETMARLCWPGQSAIGKKLHSSSPNPEPKYEVVGVVGDARVLSFTDVVAPTYYRPYQEGSGMSVIGGPPARFVLRTSIGPQALAAAVRHELKAAEPGLQMPVLAVAQQVLYDSTQAQRTYRNYLGLFAGLGVLLSALGIYGVLAYSVARRTREIGIRMAIGADPGAVLGLVMGEGARLIGAGIVVGLLAAFWLTRFLRSQLFNVSPTDPLVLIAAITVLSAVAVFACWWPARRAAKVNPMVALRSE